MARFGSRCTTELYEPVVGERQQMKDGKLPVPTGPGLGVTLNRKALEKYRIV